VAREVSHETIVGDMVAALSDVLGIAPPSAILAEAAR